MVWIKHRGIQIIFLVGLYLLLAPHLPLDVHRGLYSISLLIKDTLVWMLPITVGLFIAYAVCGFQKRAPLFILALLLFEGFSNFFSVWYAYGAGHLISESLPPILTPKTQIDFTPLFRLPLLKPSWWSPEKGTLLGLLIGAIAAFGKFPPLQQALLKSKNTAEWILTRVFAKLIPFFVLGFIARMYSTQLLSQMTSQYALLLGWLIFFTTAYLFFLFFVGSGGSFKQALKEAKNLLPPGILAFTSSCSLSTMPWTIAGTAKNIKNPSLAQVIIPATTNIQQIGDCIANAFLCFLFYTHFFGHSPNISMWMQFSIMFSLARFATAAVMGGAIFVMLPIYESYLNFNPEMIALILAFNVILDPLITSFNVIANGALCRIFERLWTRKGIPTVLDHDL